MEEMNNEIMEQTEEMTNEVVDLNPDDVEVLDAEDNDSSSKLSASDIATLGLAIVGAGTIVYNGVKIGFKYGKKGIDWAKTKFAEAKERRQNRKKEKELRAEIDKAGLEIEELKGEIEEIKEEEK